MKIDLGQQASVPPMAQTILGSHFVLTMPDNKFWSIGECVRHAWKDGKALKK